MIPVSSATELPSFADVLLAAERIKPWAHRTPVLRSRTADTELGAQLFFKCENFQRMGAFKFRGAMNALTQFDATQRKHGVITFSSGNHAQGTALAAQLLGIPAVIVMPQDAPAAKVAATRGYGAEVVTYDRYTEDREAIGARRAAGGKMNLIALNPGPGIRFETPLPERVESFQNIVKRSLPCFVRKPRGRDIYAACGQLKRAANDLVAVSPN